MSTTLKRLMAPRSWSIKRKTHKWAIKTSPGPHTQESSVPLTFLLRDMLGVCKNAREASIVINSGKVKIDGRIVRDTRYPVGLMDVVSLNDSETNYRVLIDTRAKIRVVNIPADRAGWKLARIEGKNTLRGKKIQLNMHDGHNILVADTSKYKTGDVLKIEFSSQKIIETYKLSEGNMAFLTGGRHVGEFATVAGIDEVRSSMENVVLFKDGFSTTKKNVFVVGREQPEIVLPEKSVMK